MSSSISFNLQHDMPLLRGRVILVTGGNVGLGEQCILEYARHNPAEIWLGSRNLEKAKAAVEEIQAQLETPAAIKLLKLDLSSLGSVQQVAKSFTAEANCLDILMLNAGIMGTPPSLTIDFYESQFGTNYLDHALLAKLLLPIMKKTAKNHEADVCVIVVLLELLMNAPKEGIRFDSLKTDGSDISTLARYGQSTFANLWTRKMARLYPELIFTAIHPGVVQINLSSSMDSVSAYQLFTKAVRLFLAGVDKGARNQLWASVAKGVKSGEYYKPVRVAGGGTDLSKDDELAEKLWNWTERQLATITA